MAADTIYIYNDVGVSLNSSVFFKEAINLSKEFVGYTLKTINAQEVIVGDWREKAVAFLMPGGADLAYCTQLNGQGNAQIKEFVETGGVYIGFCAGAYYGSRYCNFHKNDERGYEVLGDRELAFFPGEAIGPVLSTYTYQSEQGARIAEIEYYATEDHPAQHHVYYNGGCLFEKAEQYENVSVLARYKNKRAFNFAAIVECKIGLGKAILSGVHPEISVEMMRHIESNMDRLDYKHLQDNLIPLLSDGSHKQLFKQLMKRMKIN